MSSIVAEFDPTTSTSATFPAPNSAASGALVFFNESQNSITLTFADGSNMYLPAWYHRHKCGYSASVNITWQIHTTLVSGSPPMSLVIVEAFAQGEHFPADGPLVRQTNGDVTSTVTGSTLVNTGNPAGTPDIIQLANTTSAGNITTVDNSGNLVNGNAAFPGSFTQYGPTSLDNGAVTTDGNGNIAANTLKSAVASGTGLTVIASSRLDNGSITTNGSGTITSRGLKCVAGGYTGSSGDQLARLGSCAGTGSGTFNHNLGATPDFMAITTHAVNSTQTVGYDSETSTQVHVNTGAGLAWFALLTKRT